MGLMDLPEMVGNAIGSDATMGGLILSFAVIAMVGLLLTSVSKDKQMNMTSMFVLVVLAGLLTAIGWFPLGLLLVGVIAAVALVLLKFFK
jgi:hypothetical protein